MTHASSCFAINDGNVSDFQREELLKQIASGSLRSRQMQIFLDLPKVEILALPTIVTDGRGGNEILKELAKNKYNIHEHAQSVVAESAYVSTDGKKYMPVVVRSSDLGDKPTLSEVYRVIHSFGGTIPTAECALYLREMMSDEHLEKMGMWWVRIMHDPIEIWTNDAIQLQVARYNGGNWLTGVEAGPDVRLDQHGGFMFLLRW